MGEQIGKWIDAAAYAALIADDQELLNRVNELIDRLPATTATRCAAWNSTRCTMCCWG